MDRPADRRLVVRRRHLDDDVAVAHAVRRDRRLIEPLDERECARGGNGSRRRNGGGIGTGTRVHQRGNEHCRQTCEHRQARREMPPLHPCLRESRRQQPPRAVPYITRLAARRPASHRADRRSRAAPLPRAGCRRRPRSRAPTRRMPPVARGARARAVGATSQRGQRNVRSPPARQSVTAAENAPVTTSWQWRQIARKPAQAVRPELDLRETLDPDVLESPGDELGGGAARSQPARMPRLASRRATPRSLRSEGALDDGGDEREIQPMTRKGHQRSPCVPVRNEATDGGTR